MSFITDLNTKLNLQQFTEPKLYRAYDNSNTAYANTGDGPTIVDIQDVNIAAYDYIEFVAHSYSSNTTGGGVDLNLIFNYGDSSFTVGNTQNDSTNLNSRVKAKFVAVDDYTFWYEVGYDLNAEPVQVYTGFVARTDVTQLTFSITLDANIDPGFSIPQQGGWVILDTLSKA